jgi:nicotinate-nucleotide adenylyltransferase
MPPFGLLGGTFDPPHLGHLLLAECTLHQFGLHHITLLPAGDPYRKTRDTPGRPPVTPAHHRLAMTRLAIQDNPRFHIDERELHRPGPTYTIDTLQELHAENPGTPASHIHLILGSDALEDMPNWREPQRLFELATVLIAPKAGYPIPPEGPLPLPSHLAGALGPRTLPLVRMPTFPVSSTLIRQRVSQGLPVRYLLPDPVEAYIRQHNLYR